MGQARRCACGSRRGKALAASSGASVQGLQRSPYGGGRGCGAQNRSRRWVRVARGQQSHGRSVTVDGARIDIGFACLDPERRPASRKITVDQRAEKLVRPITTLLLL